MNDLKVKVARLSIVSNTFLIIIKVAAGILSGSVSIISEAIHSAMDLVAAIIAFFSVRVSDNPPDKRHPYGHGKIENISGVIEGLLILVAAGWIIAEAVNKLTEESAAIESVGIGSAVMLLSAVVNTFVSRRLYKVAKETNSVALEADALHLKTDVYTSLGVAAGLGLIMLTGIKWLDPVIAILVALLIIKESFNLLRKAFNPLLDEAWSKSDLENLEKELAGMGVEYQDLRTRLSGNYKFVDLHIEMPAEISLGSAHSYCDEIEEKLIGKFPHLSITIHVEPK
jgi:cation diffusion facilitator family transporter